MITQSQVKVKENELERLLDDAADNRRLMVMPIVSGIKVWVDYCNGDLTRIYRKHLIRGREIVQVIMGEDFPKKSASQPLSREDQIAKEVPHKDFQQKAGKLGLPSKVVDNNDWNITFEGYIYIPIKTFNQINSARASRAEIQYSSISEICTRILVEEKFIETEAVNSMALVLTDFDAKWKSGKRRIFQSDPINWEDSLDLFKRDKLPFAIGQLYYSKVELLDLASEKNPYIGEYDLPYDVIGITIHVDLFGDFEVSEFHHFYKNKPIKVKINRLEWEMTGKGKLLPYAVYDEDATDRDGNPIKVTRRIYLYNPKYVLDNDLDHIINKGDTVYVGKGPDGLRYIQEVDYSGRDENLNQELLPIPTNCPYCGKPLIGYEESEDGHLYCDNEYCSERFMIVVISLARNILLQDHKYKLVNSYAAMSKKVLSVQAKYPNLFGEISSDEAKGSLPFPKDIMAPAPLVLGFDSKDTKVRDIPLSMFLMGLSINGLTKECAEAIGAKFKNIEELKNAYLGDIEETKGLPALVATEVFNVLNDGFYEGIIDAMKPYLEDRSEIIILNENEKHIKEINSDLRKMYLNKVVLFDGLHFNHYREIEQFFIKSGAFIAKKFTDPTDGNEYIKYSRPDTNGRIASVNIDMNSSKMRERIQYLITGENPSLFRTQMEILNANILDNFRDNDNPEKLLAEQVIIMTEDQMMVIVDNYNRIVSSPV